MSELPVVSIVTPSFNQAHFLETTIRSVLEQDYPRIEYIVVDGGSTDGSADIIRKYEPDLAWWCSEKDGGQANAVNKGWRRATGEIWSFLNSDDLLQPGAIREVVDAFCAHPTAGLVQGDWLWIDADGREMGRGHATVTTFRALLHNAAGICQPASFYRSEVVRRVGLLDEALHVVLDYEFALRLARVSDVLHVARVLACSRLYPTTKTAVLTERLWDELFAVRARYGGRWMLKPRLHYLSYRLLRTMPFPAQMAFRRWRNSPNDRVYLDSQAISRKQPPARTDDASPQ